MWNQFRSLFFSPSQTSYPDDPEGDVPEDIDAGGQFDNLQPTDREESLEERAARLSYKNWNLSNLKKRRYHYVRQSDLPARIHASAVDGSLSHWGTSADGSRWYRIEASGDRVSDGHADDELIVAQLAELEALEAETVAATIAFYKKIAEMKASAESRNLNYDPSESFTPFSEWEPTSDE